MLRTARTTSTLRDWLSHAWFLPLLGIYLLLVAVLAGSLRERLLGPLVRRVTDGIVGVAFIGFGALQGAEGGEAADPRAQRTFVVQAPPNVT